MLLANEPAAPRMYPLSTIRSWNLSSSPYSSSNDPSDSNSFHFDPLDPDPFDFDPFDFDPVDSDPLDSDPFDSDPLDSDPLDSDPLNPLPLYPDPFDFHPLYLIMLILGFFGSTPKPSSRILLMCLSRYQSSRTSYASLKLGPSLTP